MKKLHPLSFLAMGLLLFLPACQQGPEQEIQPEVLQKVRYGVSPFQDTLLPVIGKEFGWYSDEGLEVEFVVLGWTEVQEALAAGAIDVAINNISSVIATHQQWPEFVYYYGFNIFDAGAALMGRPNFQSVEEFKTSGLDHNGAVAAALAQMKGRTVVTTGGTDMEQGVLGAAQRAGLDFRTELSIVDLNPDEGLAAFLSGTGDFYLGGIPQRTRLTKEGMKPIVVGADLAPPPLNGIVTTRTYVEEHDQALLSLLKVWFRIANFVENNTDEGAEIVLNILNRETGAGMTVEDFRVFWQNYEHYPLSLSDVERDILDPNGYSFWRARWDDCNWYFAEVKGTVEHPVPPEGVFLMEEVHERLRTLMGDSQEEENALKEAA